LGGAKSVYRNVESWENAMRHAVVCTAVFCAGAVAGGVSVALVHAQAAPYETRQIIKTPLNNLPGQELLVFESTWQPGFRLPLHTHPNGHEVTYVIDGEQTFYIEGIGTKLVKAGEAIYTPPNTPHFGSNLTDKPSRTVVIRIKDADKPIMLEVGANAASARSESPARE
jgi:quercetin dioxygenase-like cupin family protein